MKEEKNIYMRLEGSGQWMRMGTGWVRYRDNGGREHRKKTTGIRGISMMAIYLITKNTKAVRDTGNSSSGLQSLCHSTKWVVHVGVGAGVWE